MNVLDKIVEDTIKRIELEKKKNVLKKLENYIKEHEIECYKLKLSESIKKAKETKNPVITEIKPTSPSNINIRKIDNIDYIAKDMILGGCCGISVLTEPKYFNGSYMNLKSENLKSLFFLRILLLISIRSTLLRRSEPMLYC